MAEKNNLIKLNFKILTFGCQMNYSDSERVAAVLEATGYTSTEEEQTADLIIFNTCSIRQKGEDRVLGMLKNMQSLKKSHPGLLIGLTGCMVRKSSTKNSSWDEKDLLLKNLKILDFVFNIKDTQHLPEILLEAEPNLDIADQKAPPSDDYLSIKPHYSNSFQAFVPIQVGCDKFCSYCIVPFARGREQSRPMDQILQECRDLVAKGCKEITLVGQTVNSYGLSLADQKSELFSDYHDAKKENPVIPFVKLLEEIDKLSSLGLNRLRYTSSHPKDFSDDLIAAHGRLNSLCDHLHLPVQSGDDEVLKKMNRTYNAEKFRHIVEKFRETRPLAAVTTDVIVGFSGETEEQFKNTRKLLEELEPDLVFISRYSERQGTLAAKQFADDISKEVKAKRWIELNDLLRKISFKQNQKYLGKTVEVLVENFNPRSKELEGRSRESKLVQFPGSTDLIGQIVNIKIIEPLEWLLKGSVVN